MLNSRRLLVTLFLVVPFAQAQNMDWRKIPQQLAVAADDTVSPGIRAARNEFFDRVYGPPPEGWFTDGPDVAPIFEEIPTRGLVTIAVTQFAEYKVIQSATGKSIYTEVQMKVEQVLTDPSGAAQPGKPLTVILPGGSPRLESGQIVQRDLRQGSESGIQPGHRYLAFLYGDIKNGEYFECAKSWDLTSGVAVPTYPFDIRAAKNGTSRFAGMVEDNFITAVKGILASNPK